MEEQALKNYEVAAQIVRQAHDKNLSLGEAAETLGFYSRTEFEQLLHEQLRTHRNESDA